MNPPRVRALLLSLLLILSAYAAADTLFLKNGGKISAGKWWYEGEEIKYTGYGGTYGIPAGEVEKIVKDDFIFSQEEESHPEERALPEDPGSLQKEVEELESRARHLQAAAGTAPDQNSEIKSQIAEIYTKIGNSFFDDKSYETAISYYTKAMEQDPDFLPPRVNMASALMVTGNYDEAKSYILEALVMHPDQPILHDLLGEIHYMLDDVREAISEWERSLQLEPGEKTSRKLARAKKELDLSERYLVSNGSHFTLRFDGEKNPLLGTEIVAFLEESYDDLAYRFSHYPQATISVVLYPDTAFYDITESPKWVGGLFDGKIRIPVGGLEKLTRGAKRMLTHELAHAFIYSKTNGNCPRWLHEGIAQIVEGKAVPPSRMIKEKAEKVDLDSLSESLDYPLFLSFTSFLEKRYSFHALLLTLDELEQGKELGKALARATGVSADELLMEWKESLTQKGE